MHDELGALHRNQTWTLVPSTADMNIIGSKWVFKIKRNPNGTINQYKARLVAKGFHQHPGIDFKETFSPVVKPSTIRVILSLAVSRGWDIWQLDIDNAFLNGHLRENVYMQQHDGFLDPSKPTHVCKLHKSLYGLHHAPRAWYD